MIHSSFYSPAEYCPLCREWIGPRERKGPSSTKDHFVPRFMGGTKKQSNIWRLCRSCNEQKAHRFPTPKETVLFSISKGFCIS
ncbi:HNH endonuclease [Paracoccus haematequi]|uniref:HNH endonuclease n=1 Tax=Paracoccus haematequi TaxID=2491866 RepID=UPI000F7DEBBB